MAVDKSMGHSSLKNIAWWTLWGLAIGAGLFALKESFRDSLYFIVAMPLVAGSLAAGVSRLSHEFRSAAGEARWLAIGSLVLFAACGFLYIRAGGYGPFSTAGSQKAFLRVTFGMSVPEVERALDRRLVPLDSPKELAGVNAWLIDLVTPARSGRTQYLLTDLDLLGGDCQARLDFFSGRLGHVLIDYDKLPKDAAESLLSRLREELARNYHADAGAASIESSSSTATVSGPMIFRNDSVEAHLLENPADAATETIAVDLSYLPLVHSQPLHADRQVF